MRPTKVPAKKAKAAVLCCPFFSFIGCGEENFNFSQVRLGSPAP